MEILFLVILIAVTAWVLKSKEQARRITLLRSHLGKYQIEKLMENLTEGYMRCLNETDAERRDQIWSMLNTAEAALADQFNRFAAGFERIDEVQTRTSKLPLALPFADRIFPAATFDARKVFAIHAQGIAGAASNTLGHTPKQKAFTMLAELFLMQHSCHWFCRSKSVASARLLARHQTTYALALDSVAPATRKAYLAVVGN